MRQTAIPPDWRAASIGDIAAPVPNAIVDGPFGSNLKLSDYVEEGRKACWATCTAKIQHG